MKTPTATPTRHRRCKRRPLFLLGYFLAVAFGCAALTPPADLPEDIPVAAGQRRSGTLERVDFAMNYQLFYETSGALRIDAQIVPKTHLAELTIWLTAYDAAGRSLERHLLFHSSYRRGYKGRGGPDFDRRLPMPEGVDHVAFSSLATRKEHR